MSVFASLPYPTRPCANCLTWKNASFQLRALLAAVLVSLLAFVVSANGQTPNIINTVAGGGTVNSSPASADIPGPTSLIEDAQGNVYVTAPFSEYVFELSGGVVTQFTGVGYIADHAKPGQAKTEPMWNAYSLAIDKLGNIYLADTGNNSVRKITPSGEFSTIAGVSKPCYQGRCGDNGPATSAKLNAPQGVAVDFAGNVYIADTGDNRVRVIKTDGNIYPFAGNYNVASCSSPTSPCGDGGPGPKASLNAPIGLAVDSKNNVYIADSGDNRIRVMNVKTRIINAFAGSGNSCAPSTNPCGDGGSALQANLGAPRGVSVDKAFNVYIADTRDNRIRVVTSGTINTFAGTGIHGFQGDGGSPASAQLAGPNGVLVDGAGNVFIADTGNQRVREVTAGVIQTIFGGGNGGDGAGATAAQLADPYGVALDSSNNYYIADTVNNRIREVSGGNIQTVAGNGLNGYSGDGGAATSAELNSPLGLAVDGSGNIFIADTNNRVVREVSGGNITTFAGTGAPCNPPTGGCGDGGAAVDAKLTAPSTVAVDSNGNVFIADPSSEKVREVSNGIINTFAGTGNAGRSGDGGPATAAELKNPSGVAVDASDNVYIADAGNNVIRCVLGAVGGCGDVQHTYAVGDIITYAYNGAIMFQGDGGLAINASRWNPTHVAVDSRGNLFIGGGNDEVVQRVDLATGIIVTVAGNDTTAYFYGFSGDGGLATKAHIDNAGLAIDSNESLYIADAGNNRIREVAHMVPVATLSAKVLNFGDETVGQQSAPMTVTLTNTGSDDLSLTSITTTGDFAETNQCATMLAPSQSCTISVTFTPTKKGARTGQLKVTDNAPLSPQTVKLEGTGT